MIYGYARVSTAKQAANGTSLEQQVEQLKAAGAAKVYKDAYTGTRMDRPAFTELMAVMQEGDTFIATKLDRFARTAVEGIQAVQSMTARGIKVQILNMGTIDNTPCGKLTMTIMLAFAEFERDMIVERTQAGRSAARAKAEAEGRFFLDGRPAGYTEMQINHAMDLLRDGNSYTQVAKLTGISKSTLIRARQKEKAAQLDA